MSWAKFRRRCGRVLVASMVGGLAAVAVAGPVFADPPVPTDYRSEVVSIVPAVDGLNVRVVGGDSFLEITAPAGVTVLVAGYRGEPYLRFLPDGSVEENRRSPSTWSSRDRSGSAPVPADASVDAEPVWRRVANDGRWSWHDHRAHWMGVRPPLGLGPGDVVADAVVPVTVDGTVVEIRVVSVWQPAPSRWPIAAGVLIGGVVALGACSLGRRRPGVAAAMAVLLAAAATVVGVWQHRSLPPETGSPMRGWLLPSTALVAAAAGVVWRRRAAVVPLSALAAGVQLLQWVWLRRTGWSRPVLPTSAPFWLDRAVSAGVAVGAVVCVGIGIIGTVRWLLAPTTAATASN